MDAILSGVIPARAGIQVWSALNLPGYRFRGYDGPQSS